MPHATIAAGGQIHLVPRCNLTASPSTWHVTCTWNFGDLQSLCGQHKCAWPSAEPFFSSCWPSILQVEEGFVLGPMNESLWNLGWVECSWVQILITSCGIIIKKMVFVNSYWYNAPKTFLGNKSVACILIRWLTEERGLSNFKMKTGHKKDQAMIRKLALSVLLLYLPWKKRGAGDWVWSPIANDLISYAYVLKPP